LRFGVFNANFLQLVCNQTSADTQTLQVASLAFASVAQSNLNICFHTNGRAPSKYVDSRFAALMITWRGGAVYFYLDGQFIASTQTVFASPMTSQMFSVMTIGSNNGAGSSFWGNYWIRRLQITNTFTQIPLAGPQIAFLGDSFVLRGTSGSQ